jgi:MerR family transcriptional regulator, heat shock protein HspR
MTAHDGTAARSAVVEEFVTIEYAADAVGLTPSRIRRYIRIGLVAPTRSRGRQPLLGADELARLRRIRRLADDLGLNVAGIEVALHLLDRMGSGGATADPGRGRLDSGRG